MKELTDIAIENCRLTAGPIADFPIDTVRRPTTVPFVIPRELPEDADYQTLKEIAAFLGTKAGIEAAVVFYKALQLTQWTGTQTTPLVMGRETYDRALDVGAPVGKPLDLIIPGDDGFKFLWAEGTLLGEPDCVRVEFDAEIVRTRTGLQMNVWLCYVTDEQKGRFVR